MKLPNRVFAAVMQDEDSLILASRKIDGFDDGTVIGIYELVDTQRLRVRRELVPAKKRKNQKRSR